MMSTDPRSEAENVLHILTMGRVVEREAVHSRLAAGDATIDRDHLRGLILQALQSPFDAASSAKDADGPKAWARCWLLSTLGRITDDDPVAGACVRQCTTPAGEPNPWARYWAIEGLVVANAPDLPAVANGVLAGDEEPLVRNLATAILAREGDSDALQELQASVAKGDWVALRALRIVPIEETVGPICELVSAPELSNTTYDSIAALAVIPPTWSCCDAAATTLIACIKGCRRHPWWDSLRTKALYALGRLKAPEAEPIFIRELSDSNPSIVFEAAKSLERVVGVSKATARIAEAASQTGPEAIGQYATALRWMDREKVAEELESIMLTGSMAQQNTARELLSEIGGRAAFEKLRIRADTMKQHVETLEKTEQGIRELFDSSLREAQSGYRLSTMMDFIVFFLGVGLVVLSAVLVFRGKETLAGLTATGGALSILYNLFLANPRKRVQEAVGYLMALKVIFLGYLRQLHQADKAYVRRFMDESPLEPNEVRQYSEIVADTMRDAVGQIRQRSAKPRSGNAKPRSAPPGETGKPLPAITGSPT